MEVSQEIMNKICQHLIRFLSVVQQELDHNNKLKEWKILEECLKKLEVVGQHGTFEENSHYLAEIKTALSANQSIQAEVLVATIIKNLTDFFRPNYSRAFVISLNVLLCREHLVSVKEFTDPIAQVRKIVSCIISLLKIYYSTDKNSWTPTALLCFNQLSSNWPLFRVSFEKSCPLIRSYSTGCLIECMGRLGNEPWETFEKPCCEFLDLMDVALGCLDEVAEHADEWMRDTGEKVNHLKGVIDELLCHSMSTVQVAPADEDRQIISSTAQKILRYFESLRDDMAGDNESSVRFSANILSDTLCSLERAVNSAVLRLVLFVQCCEGDPLKRLVQECTVTGEESRNLSSLNTLITQFDSFIDKLMLIGTFAVSCTSSLRKSMRLKSCMASFESLEAVLIPSVSKLYMQSSSENKLNMLLLVNQWKSELDKFLSVLDTIVDPAAYTEVVKQHIEKLSKEIMENTEKQATTKSVKKILRAAKTLISVTRASIKQEPNEKDKEKLEKHAQSLVDASNGCEHLLKKKAEIPVLLSVQLKHLHTKIENLWEYFAEKVAQIEDSASLLDSFEVLKPGNGNNYYQLCRVDDESNSMLRHQIARAQVLVKEPVFYNTPKRKKVPKTPLITPSMRAAASNRKPISSLRRLCFRSNPAHSSQLENDVQDVPMDLTELLDNLTSVDETFTMNETAHAGSRLQNRQLVDLFAGWEEQREMTDLTSARCSAFMDTNVPTPDRINDLELLEEKLGNLKAGLEAVK